MREEGPGISARPEQEHCGSRTPERCLPVIQMKKLRPNGDLRSHSKDVAQQGQKGSKEDSHRVPWPRWPEPARHRPVACKVGLTGSLQGGALTGGPMGTGHAGSVWGEVVVGS